MKKRGIMQFIFWASIGVIIFNGVKLVYWGLVTAVRAIILLMR